MVRDRYASWKVVNFIFEKKPKIFFLVVHNLVARPFDRLDPQKPSPPLTKPIFLTPWQGLDFGRVAPVTANVGQSGYKHPSPLHLQMPPNGPSRTNHTCDRPNSITAMCNRSSSTHPITVYLMNWNLNKKQRLNIVKGCYSYTLYDRHRIM